MFDSLVGNQGAKEILRRMLAAGRVPGALLFAGEDGVGKKQFALELARALNCRALTGTEACGKCGPCVRTGKYVLPVGDTKEIKDAYKKIIWTDHSDVGLIHPYNRSIYIDAVRDLEREANFRPVEGSARVFIVEEADKLSDSSSNALLKTLEEPHATSHIVLVTSRPASLLPTIRSRCQAVRFAPLPAEEIERFLSQTKKRAGPDARLAALLSRGRLGPALTLDVDAVRQDRESLLEVLDALAVRGDRARLLRIAEGLSDTKSKDAKDAYEQRLDMLETLIRDLWVVALRSPSAGIVNEDIRERLSKLSANLRPARAARWLERVEELRSQLAVNVNRRASTDALFLAMASD
jgi:DNA polymerase-3 subunit delta'